MYLKREKIRQDFLEGKSEAKKKAYKLIFKKANDFENKIGKPFEQLTEDEFYLFFKEKLIGKSTSSSDVRRSLCKKYLQYVNNNCYDIITRKDISNMVDDSIKKQNKEISEYELRYISWNDLKTNFNRISNEIDIAIICLIRMGVSGKSFVELSELKTSSIDFNKKQIYLDNRVLKINDEYVLQVLKDSLNQNSYTVLHSSKGTYPKATKYEFNMMCEYLIKQKPKKNNNNGLNCYTFSGITGRLHRIFHELGMNISSINLLQSHAVDKLIEHENSISKVLSIKEAKDFLNSIKSTQSASDVVNIAKSIREKNKVEFNGEKCFIESNIHTDTNNYKEEANNNTKTLGDTIRGIEILNQIYENATIEEKYALTKVIERGEIANEIKKYVHYKCQICELLGNNPYSFKKKNGEYYIETHHIIPVSDTKNSKLSVDNLICLCPNHHRQLHYGNVDIIDNNNIYIEFNIDGVNLKINKITLNRDLYK